MLLNVRAQNKKLNTTAHKTLTANTPQSLHRISLKTPQRCNSRKKHTQEIYRTRPRCVIDSTIKTRYIAKGPWVWENKVMLKASGYTRSLNWFYLSEGSLKIALTLSNVCAFEAACHSSMKYLFYLFDFYPAFLSLDT